MKKLGKFELAVLKRNMANEKPFSNKIERLNEVIRKAEEEKRANEEQLERYEVINKEMTGGLTGAEYMEALQHPELFEEIPEDANTSPVDAEVAPEVEVPSETPAETPVDNYMATKQD